MVFDVSVYVSISVHVEREKYIGIDWKVLASQDVIVAATIQNSGSLEYELSVFVFAWRFSMAHMESCRHAL